MRHKAGRIVEIAGNFDSTYSLQKQYLLDLNEMMEEIIRDGLARVGDEIELPDGRVFTVVDSFAKSNLAWRSVPIRRLDLETVKAKRS